MDGTRADEFEKPITVRVARTLDDMQRIAVIRSLVYMAEQDCPYDEEFDGNDLAGATHLIGEAGGEPLGCLRIRWFADFAKIERVCVRSGHRSGRVARKVMAEAIEIIRRKGYRSFVGHVQEHLIPYWKRYGFIHRQHRGVFVFSDRAYAEMEGRPEPHPDALCMDTDPLVLDRPEGDWDRPGPLDRSVQRGVSPLQERDAAQRHTAAAGVRSRIRETAS
jgi:predicted GNAT family N-acyltransferase